MSGSVRRTRLVIFSGRVARSFGIGVLNVALPLSLKDRGLGTSEVFAVLSAGLAGATLQTAVVGQCGCGGRRLALLAVLTGAMAASAAALIVVRDAHLLMLLALLGGLCMQPNIAAQVPLEQASLADSTKNKDERSEVFGWYNGLSSAALSLGSLASGLPIPGAPVDKDEVAAFAAPFQICGVSAVLLVMSTVYAAQALGEARQESLEGKDGLLPQKDLPLAQCRHARRIVSLASIFAFDAWAGGIALQGVLTYWLATQFNAQESEIGILFAVCSVLGTASYTVAVWLGKRIGLINTMVFTHLPANVTLILTPFMPNIQLVYALFLIRASLSQMDVPARDVFMMSVVGKEERLACSSSVNIVRSLACVLGPLTGAWLWQTYGPAAPLIVCGSVKCAYDLSLLAIFRSMQPVDED